MTSAYTTGEYFKQSNMDYNDARLQASL